MENYINYIETIYINWDKVPESSYVMGINSINRVEELHLTSPVTFLVGNNGSGKSTLLEAIAVSLGLNREGGTENYEFSSYVRTGDEDSEVFGFDDVSPLHEAMRVGRSYRRPWRKIFLRAESFFNLATKSMYYELAGGSKPMYGERTLRARSHGESFMDFITATGNGLYLIDEPEAALSVNKQMELLTWMYDTVQDGAQWIVATHSPFLMAFPGADIIDFNDGPIHSIEYEDTDVYQITKYFINNYKSVINELTRPDA